VVALCNDFGERIVLGGLLVYLEDVSKIIKTTHTYTEDDRE
jgi:hypothetical protein